MFIQHPHFIESIKVDSLKYLTSYWFIINITCVREYISLCQKHFDKLARMAL